MHGQFAGGCLANGQLTSDFFIGRIIARGMFIYYFRIALNEKLVHIANGV